MNSPLIGIIMGSASDIPVVEKGTKVLDELGIPYELAIASASEAFFGSRIRWYNVR